MAPIAEAAGVTGSTAPDAVNGTVLFADVDLNDTHTVSTNVASAIWSGGGALPGGLAAALATALRPRSPTAPGQAPARFDSLRRRGQAPSTSSPPARR